MMWMCFVLSPYEVHDCDNHVYSSTFAMICMDINYFVALIRNLYYGKLHGHGEYK